MGGGDDDDEAHSHSESCLNQECVCDPPHTIEVGGFDASGCYTCSCEPVVATTTTTKPKPAAKRPPLPRHCRPARMCACPDWARVAWRMDGAGCPYCTCEPSNADEDGLLQAMVVPDNGDKSIEY
jgi:hypothetical protein